MRYKTPKALEQAVKAAAVKSGRDTNRAIAGFYHDRFLCRVFASSEPAFVLKGGQSMLAKIPDARETRDVDLLGRTPDLDEAQQECNSASDYTGVSFQDPDLQLQWQEFTEAAGIGDKDDLLEFVRHFSIDLNKPDLNDAMELIVNRL